MGTLKIIKKHHKHLNNPFPSPPKSRPSIEGSLLFNSETLQFHQIFQLGTHFHLLWTTLHGGYISISHHSNPSKSLWSTIPGQAFVSAGAIETEVEESRGSFVINDLKALLVCDHQIIEDIRVIHNQDSFFESGFSPFDQKIDTQFPALIITGILFSKSESGIPKAINLEKIKESSSFSRYWVLFDQKKDKQIGFRVKLGHPELEIQPKTSLTRLGKYQRLRKKIRRIGKRKLGFGRWFRRPRGFIKVCSSEERESLREFNRIWVSYSSEANESFFGFGEQFSHMDFKGKRVPILVQEQGIGRGDQPITFAANLISYRAGGDWSTTYAPSPFYMTSKMKSLYLDGYNYSVFDLTRHDRVQIQIHNNTAQGRILYGDSPSELIECFTETIGRPPELPKWIISGAVVGMQGGTEAVRHIWNQLKSYKVPISAFWLQDWVGQRETFIGSQLWWNWEVDTTRYKGWKQLINDLGAHHIKVMTYCNPCIAPTDEKLNRRRNHFKEAKELDILVKDKNGETYMVPNTAFDVGMLDLTHPNTSTWFKQILHEMVDDGVRGWMADFGEGLPLDAILYSGEDPISAHNRYPELWAQINREFTEHWKETREGKEKEDPEEALVFFMRAGFRDSPKWGILFWEGDQMVSWQDNDGIKSAVVGLLSGGLSGYALNHSDIGGYCAISMPFINYHRSQELLMRWMELNAFTTVLRTHEEASQKGLPVCRHLFIHYPNDMHVLKLSYQQFLVGSEILVVPVLDKGKENVKVYFPEGESCSWKHVWSGKIYSEQSCEAWIEAPIGYPAIFIKDGSFVGESFLKNLRNLGVL